MATGPLQIKAVGRVLIGGYTYGCPGMDGNPTSGLQGLPDNCEWTHLESNYLNWTDTSKDNDWHEATISYIYSDSVVALNSRSSKVKITNYVRYRMADVTETNDIVVEVYSYLRHLERYDVIGNPVRGTFNIRVSGYYGAGQPAYNFWPDASGLPTDAAVGGTYFAGQHEIGHFTLTLPPEASSENLGTLRVENGFQGRFGNGVYADDMIMGLSFRNNLPAEIPQPDLDRESQEADICNNSVTVTHTFNEIILSGTRLVVWWRFEGQDWSDNRSVSTPVQRETKTTVTITGLPPSTKVYWRAQYVPAGGNSLRPSKYYEWTSDTMWIPSRDMTVPDISEYECATVTQGGLLNDYTSFVCYNDVACIPAKIKVPDCNQIKQEMADYEDPGCKDRGRS